jgi:hypothetical protein
MIWTRHLRQRRQRTPSSPYVGICPVPGVRSIESRSGQSRDQSEVGDSACRPCAPGVHKPGCTNLPVQPGCTNVSLSPLLQSMTNARDDGCAGCSQESGKKPNTNRAWRAFTHKPIVGEDKAKIKRNEASEWEAGLEGRMRYTRRARPLVVGVLRLPI